MANFTHLHTHSHYSLLDGLAKIDDLINRAKELNMDSLALTDHGVLYGAVEFYKKSKKSGIKPILGVEAYIAPKSRFDRDPAERYFHLVILAENNLGWQNLIKLVSQAHIEGYYYKPRADKELLLKYSKGLIALSGCHSGEISRAIIAGRDPKPILEEYLKIFGSQNFFLEIGYHPNIDPENHKKLWRGLINLSKETGVPLVATQDIHYVFPEDREYHDILLAVQTGNRLSDDDRLTLKADDFSMTSPEQMKNFFKEIPEAIENTIKIAERCNVELPLGEIHLPDFPKPEGKTANEFLRELIKQKINKRFSEEEQKNEEFKKRLEYEIEVIEKTGFADYFLIVQDIVEWAKNHNIAVGPGRGSAAGSLVSYILGITDINPIKYGLIFERFLNPERIQMPDVDMDFADTRRNEVLSYVREKYGNDRVAQIITFGTMAARAAVRDTGRAIGLPYSFCDKIAKLIPPNTHITEAIQKIPELKELYENNPDAKRLLEAATHLEGVARHASIHACGVVITKEPLTNYLPLQLAPQDKNSIITQFEMNAVADLGLLKMDLLGLKNLTIIEETIRLVKETKGEEIKIEELPLDDEKTFELLRRAETVGIFQLEGSGMRRYLKELKPTELEDIIVMISLYRPGPLDAGMVPKYIRRKNGQEKVTYLHPKLEPILKKTYGIVVYQEQLMEIARSLAGFSFSEADTLRKAVGKKIKSLLDEQAEKMIKGMIKNGIPEDKAREIWEWFEPFARYGFNRSHAACYAIIAYRTAYLKAHYPVEFMAELLNAESNDIERIAFLIQEAKQAGLEILPPDINKSFINFTPESKKIRFGLVAIKNVGEEIAKNIIEERIARGPFKNFEDFLIRVRHKDLNKKSLESFIKSGVFDSLGLDRKQAIENIEEILRFSSTIKKSNDFNFGQSSLFGNISQTATLKMKAVPPASIVEKLLWEKELLGFYLSDQPINYLSEKIKNLKALSLKEVRSIKNENIPVRIIGLISKVQRVLTKAGQPMLFVTLEDLSQDSIEVIVFNNTLSKTLPIWEENNIVLIEGKISRKNGEPKIICNQVAKIKIA